MIICPDSLPGEVMEDDKEEEEKEEEDFHPQSLEELLGEEEEDEEEGEKPAGVAGADRSYRLYADDTSAYSDRSASSSGVTSTREP